MSDQSLMNPDFLNKELEDLPGLILKAEELSDQVHADIRRIYDMISPTYNRHEPTMLTTDQVREIIHILANIDLNRHRYSMAEKLAERVYAQLKKDRRWLIASKLRFLVK